MEPKILLLGVISGHLTILISLASSHSVYIPAGSHITVCNMTCPQPAGVLELYRRCEGFENTLVEIHCNKSLTMNYHMSRLYLDRKSNCWKLTQAGKKDSCVYITEFRIFNQTSQLFSVDVHVESALGGGAIAGIVVGVICFLIFMAGIIYRIVKAPGSSVVTDNEALH